MSASELRTILYEVEQGVALVTLNRPDRLNAWTNRMAAEYRWALATADADPAVRVVVVTGAGRGFCAGADFRALDVIASSGAYETDRSSGPPLPEAPQLQADDADFDHPFTFPLGLRKPVIAAVNGPAAGVGFVLMCFTDIRFAARGAKLTTSFARLALPAEHGVSWLLARLVGPARAADLLFSSRVVLAEEAAEMGLVNAVLDPEELLPHSLAYARRMAAETSPNALSVIKRQLWTDVGGGLDAAATEAYALMVRMVGASDFSEGIAAFQAKRPPNFAPLA